MSCLVGVLFGGLGVDVDDGSEDVVGVLLFRGMDGVKEILMRLSRTKIILLLIKMDFHLEGGLWKMFGDEACGKARPWNEVAAVDGGYEGRFDGAEGCRMKLLGEFKVGGVVVENVVGLAWMGTCKWLLIRGGGF